jgi:hypothetical protein
MRRGFILVCILIGTGTVYSQNFHQRLFQDQKENRITESDALFLQGIRIIAPETLPEHYQDDLGLPVKSAFGLIFMLQNRWEDFNLDQKSMLKSMLMRPDLPYNYISPSGHFKIHYSTTGADAVSLDDFDLSGIPDYVEEAANSIDYAYYIEVTQMGFNPPPDDLGRDGVEWDVYVRNIPGAYGWTNLEMQDPDNQKAWITYICVDNDYTHTPTKGLDGLRVTMAHEFFHMVQLGYNGRDENSDSMLDDLFLMEAGSTWMEDVVYDYVNDYYYYLSGFFSNTNKPLNYTDGWREYGLCIWFHFLEKRTGGRDIARTIWENIVDYPALEATALALESDGHQFEDELARFYGWNYMTGTRADTTRFYPEGDNYPQIQVDSFFSFQMDTTITGEVLSTASKYFHLYEESGPSYTLIPTCVFIEETDDPFTFNLTLMHNGGSPLNTDLGHGVQARLSSEDYAYWKCVAVIESSGQEVSFILFDGTQESSFGDDLPASYPNPFVLDKDAYTTIPFNLKESCNVTMTVYSVSGFRVRKKEQYFEAGDLPSNFRWNGLDDNGQPVPGGVYIYTIHDGSRLIRRDKVAVVR